uniref:Citrate transporter-like domain-containing protein n=1 Tax=Megaselia scalaris TaxID=36166 RepID=T1GLJ8_MEGSC
MPMMGILSSEETCQSYFKDTTVMLIGGMIIALSVEYCNLHKRLALLFIRCFTCYPRILHFALMVMTFFLSTMMTNTTTASIMFPIVRAILDNLSENGILRVYEPKLKTETDHRPTKFAIAFYLGVAYSATIGGTSSLIGTGTNMAFKYEWIRIYEKLTDKGDVGEKFSHNGYTPFDNLLLLGNLIDGSLETAL